MKRREENEALNPFRDYVKKRLIEGNPITAHEMQEAFKEAFSGFFESAFKAELEAQLGYSKYDYKNKEINNSRNGYSKKRLKSDIAGEFEVDIPRDRNGEYEPQLVGKYQKDISSIDEKILSMYAKGMSTDAINSHIEEIYKFSVSKEQITRVTDKVLPIAKEW
jgi:transposase-like protein